MRFCPKCGTPHTTAYQVCVQCGTPFTGKAPVTEQLAATPKESAKLKKNKPASTLPALLIGTVSSWGSAIVGFFVTLGYLLNQVHEAEDLIGIHILLIVWLIVGTIAGPIGGFLGRVIGRGSRTAAAMGGIILTLLVLVVWGILIAVDTSSGLIIAVLEIWLGMLLLMGLVGLVPLLSDARDKGRLPAVVTMLFLVVIPVTGFFLRPWLISRCLPDCPNRNLSGIDWIGRDLTGADLRWANLSKADLSKASLRDANLSGADLRGAHLKMADLYRANLSWTKLDDTTQIDDKWQLVWEIINQGAAGRTLSQADLNGAYLREADLGKADLSGANLGEADLSKASLRDANLSGAHLEGANLLWTDLRGADLREADLSEADLSKASLRDANLGGANLGGANLSRADLRETDLSEADLLGAKLGGATCNSATIWPSSYDPEEAGAILVDQ